MNLGRKQSILTYFFNFENTCKSKLLWHILKVCQILVCDIIFQYKCDTDITVFLTIVEYYFATNKQYKFI